MAAPMETCSGNDVTFTITVEGKNIRCNKDLLMEHSGYFRGMLNSSMVESKTNTVTLHGMKFDIVSTLIDYMSSGELYIQTETIEDLTETAMILMIEGAIQSCVSYYSSIIEDQNCLSIMLLSVKLNFQTLYNLTRRHALYYFNKVWIEEEFLHLEPQPLLDYLSDPHLNCSCEVDILDALLTWYQFNTDDRKDYVENLLTKCFHSEDLLKDDWPRVQQHELIQEFAKDKYLGHCSESKKFRELPHVILTVGGQYLESDEFCSNIYRFDKEEKQFNTFMDIKTIYPKTSKHMGFQATVVGKDLYFTGGQESMVRSSWILDVWKFDTFTAKWEKITSLKSPRRHHGACGSNDSLFLVGGFGKFRDILDTAVQYDTIQDTWIDLPKMPFKWYTPRAVYGDNKVFVVKSCMIYLDLNSQQWTTLSNNYNEYQYVSFVPVFYDKSIYEFPILEDNQEYFVVKTNYANDSSELISGCRSSENVLGNEVFMFQNLLFTFARNSNKLLSANISDIGAWEELSCTSLNVNNCSIVVLPIFPEYAIKK